MFSRFWLHAKSIDRYNLTIDCDQPPHIPNGTRGILRDAPIGTGTLVVRPGDIEIQALPPNVTYAAYVAAHQHLAHIDARILDALFAQANSLGSLDGIYRHLGERRGQFFFFGTTFEMHNTSECVTFLNVNTNLPLMPHLRYQCPAHDPIRWDLPTYACIYRPSH